MNDDLQALRAELATLPEYSTRAADIIEQLYTAGAAAHAAQRTAESERYAPVGTGWAVEQPPAAAAPAEEPAEPRLRLSQKFSGYEATVAAAEVAAKTHGFADRLPGVLSLFDGVQAHEVLRGGADPAARLERADRIHDQLVSRHGVERADELVAAWREALTALGLTRLVYTRGLDTSVDAVEHLGDQWLRRTTR